MLLDEEVWVLYLKIIPRALVGCNMVDSQRGVYGQVAYNCLISNKHEWNNCFFKNTQRNALKSARIICAKDAHT